MATMPAALHTSRCAGRNLSSKAQIREVCLRESCLSPSVDKCTCTGDGHHVSAGFILRHEEGSTGSTVPWGKGHHQTGKARSDRGLIGLTVC
jgi:hypothetical protein